MSGPGDSQLTGAAMAVILLIVLVQVYFFETVLGAVLDGQRQALPGAFAVSAALSAVALFLAFRTRSGRKR
jgi:predicted Co/Zn/Cd cation transporter (cation efflux family)